MVLKCRFSIIFLDESVTWEQYN